MLCLLDLETAPIADYAQYLDPVKPAGNLKDPVKIAASIAEKEADRIETLATDPYLCRIVAVGFQIDDGIRGVVADVAANVNVEAVLIDSLYTLWVDGNLTPCGFCSRTYDHPVLNTRARLLGVHIPKRFRTVTRWSDNVVDLYDIVTFGDPRSERIMRRGLVSMCRRFGINIPSDDIKGVDIAAAVAEERWEDIRRHVSLDVQRTRELAKRLGVE